MSMQMILSRGMSKDEKELGVTLERRMGKLRIFSANPRLQPLFIWLYRVLVTLWVTSN